MDRRTSRSHERARSRERRSRERARDNSDRRDNRKRLQRRRDQSDSEDERRNDRRRRDGHSSRSRDTHRARGRDGERRRSTSRNYYRRWELEHINRSRVSNREESRTRRDDTVRSRKDRSSDIGRSVDERRSQNRYESRSGNDHFDGLDRHHPHGSYEAMSHTYHRFDKRKIRTGTDETGSTNDKKHREESTGARFGSAYQHKPLESAWKPNQASTSTPYETVGGYGYGGKNDERDREAFAVKAYAPGYKCRPLESAWNPNQALSSTLETVGAYGNPERNDARDQEACAVTDYAPGYKPRPLESAWNPDQASTSTLETVAAYGDRERNDARDQEACAVTDYAPGYKPRLLESAWNPDQASTSTLETVTAYGDRERNDARDQEACVVEDNASGYQHRSLTLLWNPNEASTSTSYETVGAYGYRGSNVGRDGVACAVEDYGSEYRHRTLEGASNRNYTSHRYDYVQKPSGDLRHDYSFRRQKALQRVSSEEHVAKVRKPFVQTPHVNWWEVPAPEWKPVEEISSHNFLRGLEPPEPPPVLEMEEPVATSNRGKANTRGRGGRRGCGSRRGYTLEDKYDFVITRPVNKDGLAMKKQAQVANQKAIVPLIGNFIKVEHSADWGIYHYNVEFLPDVNPTKARKKIMRDYGRKSVTSGCIFDGTSLYSTELFEPQPLIFDAVTEDKETTRVTVKFVEVLTHLNVQHHNILSILAHKCVESLNLEQIGRHFYNRHGVLRFEAYNLEVWPGFIVAMRQHERDILFGAEVTNKVLRIDNCLQVIQKYLSHAKWDRTRIRNHLVGSIVMTRYNRKTYRIDDIDWEMSPSGTFANRGKDVSFLDYYLRQYGIAIRDANQPMILSRARKRDIKKTGQRDNILLVPELCQMTGLTDEMRGDHRLMKAMADNLHASPVLRVEKLNELIKSFATTDEVQHEMSLWNLRLQRKLVEFKGHVIPKETVLLGERESAVPDMAYKWNYAFRERKPMLISIHLDTWAVIVFHGDSDAAEKYITSMKRVALPLKLHIADPVQVIKVSGQPHSYSDAVDSIMNRYRDKMQMIFVILPKYSTEIYTAVKKRTCLHFGVHSQCCIAPNARSKQLLTISTKLVIQMNAKLGGAPWTISIPLKKLMVIGFDIYHAKQGIATGSCGSMVATTSDNSTSYHSVIKFFAHRDKSAFKEKMDESLTSCLEAYLKKNNYLPERIMMYRAGIGEGHLKHVCEIEVPGIVQCVEKFYAAVGQEVAKFTYIAVFRKCTTRYFALDCTRPVNPAPGTVADDVITLPERYDFYLVSQHCRQGTVSPVCYNVLYDRSNLGPDKIQRLTFKLSHLYYNWDGTVAVPSTCQLAKKLAILTGMYLGSSSHDRLSNHLFYL